MVTLQEGHANSYLHLQCNSLHFFVSKHVADKHCED